ncbi:MAG: DUF4856 domain-containing protein [Chitinophagaceae bacterium]|nr:DUF4856 domain-containing protein [Chitinophagaceae bacterium]
MKVKLLKVAALLILGGYLTSCKKDNDNDKPREYVVPTSYNFGNASFEETTQAVNMLIGFQSYLSKATSRELSQDTVNYLWNNTNGAFKEDYVSNLTYSPDQLNTFTGVKLSGLAKNAEAFKKYADSMVKISTYRNDVAEQGKPGKVGSRLVNFSGLEFNQLVAKGLMGALQLNKVFENLDKSASADNNANVSGNSYTAMQHAWDLAFGYVGIPKDYDSSKAYANTETSRPLAIGGYFRERARPIGAGGTVFAAFLKGRAAIDNKDYSARDAAITTIKEYLEKTLAVSAYTYLSLSKTRGDDAARFHDYSEAYGFTIALEYRAANSKLTAANYQKLVDILKMDYWELKKTENATKVDEAISIFKTTYGFDF